MRHILKAALVFAAAVLLTPAAASAGPAPGATGGHATVQATLYSGVVCAGCSTTKHWNNAVPGLIYSIGYSPAGAVSPDPCVFQTVRTWYQQQPGGEREFWFTLKNIGQIDCGTDIMLSWLSNGASAWSTGGTVAVPVVAA